MINTPTGEVYGLGEIFHESRMTLEELYAYNDDRIDDDEEQSFFNSNFYTTPYKIPFESRITDICTSKNINYSLYKDIHSNAFITGSYKNLPKHMQPYLLLSNVKKIQSGVMSCAFLMNTNEVKALGENSSRHISSELDHIPLISKPKTICIDLSQVD